MRRRVRGVAGGGRRLVAAFTRPDLHVDDDRRIVAVVASVVG
jgi:hypothetical protein